MNLKAKPTIVPNTFIREEKDKMIIIPIDKNFTNITTVNETGIRIINLCNGKNCIEDIVENLKIIFDDTDTYKIYNDVIEFIEKMKRLKVINCVLENEMYRGKNINLLNNYIVHRCGEGDIEKIVSLSNKNNKIKYKEGYIYNYDEKIKKIAIRNNLFNYNEEFYILKDIDDNDLAMFSFNKVEDNYILMYTIGFFEIYSNIDIDVVCNFLNECVNDIKNNIEKDCIKIKAYINSKIKFIEDINNILNKCGFNKVAVLESEFGQGIDKIVYDKMLI